MDGAQARNGPSVDGGAGPSTSYSTADADDNGGAGGAKVWVLVLLFSLLVLLFLPSAVRRGGTSGGGGFQRGGITLKSGWDVVNLCLVLFAILCGLLGRGGGDGDGDGESASAAAAAAVKSHREVSPAMVEPEPIAEASTEDVWERLNSSYDSNQSAHTTAGIRRMKSSSSYPELRLGSDGVWGLASPELAWRPYDDAELYRPRRDEWPDRTRGDADRPRLRRTSSDVNAIPVDKYEVRAPPQDARRRRRSVEKPQKMAKVVEEEGRMHPAAETLAARPARSRTWSPEELNATLSEADKYEVPTPLGARRPRRSAEKLPKMPAVQEEHPSAETLAARPSRSRTWSPEELNATLYRLPPPSPPMPPPPPPPPMSEGEEEAPSVTASPAPSYCASPDVNTKADNFIERFRAGLKLEKINSYREKLQIQEGATVTMSEEDGEFMVIGSLFEDDDDMSLPGTPATAAAAAVAVGY
ncbi:hypothetical protein ACQ4PT_040048 [Festuca glaucescens]